MSIDLQHKLQINDGFEYKFIPKERYHIPMYMGEKWETNVDNKFIIDKTYKNLQIMNKDHVEKWDNMKLTRSSNRNLVI